MRILAKLGWRHKNLGWLVLFLAVIAAVTGAGVVFVKAATAVGWLLIVGGALVYGVVSASAAFKRRRRPDDE